MSSPDSSDVPACPLGMKVDQHAAACRSAGFPGAVREGSESPPALAALPHIPRRAVPSAVATKESCGSHAVLQLPPALAAHSGISGIVAAMPSPQHAALHSVHHVLPAASPHWGLQQAALEPVPATARARGSTATGQHTTQQPSCQTLARGQASTQASLAPTAAALDALCVLLLLLPRDQQAALSLLCRALRGRRIVTRACIRSHTYHPSALAAFLSSNECLHTLRFVRCDLGPAVLRSISRMSQLRRLELSDCQLLVLDPSATPAAHPPTGPSAGSPEGAAAPQLPSERCYLRSGSGDLKWIGTAGMGRSHGVLPGRQGLSGAPILGSPVQMPPPRSATPPPPQQPFMHSGITAADSHMVQVPAGLHAVLAAAMQPLLLPQAPPADVPPPAMAATHHTPAADQPPGQPPPGTAVGAAAASNSGVGSCGGVGSPSSSAQHSTPATAQPCGSALHGGHSSQQQQQQQQQQLSQQQKQLSQQQQQQQQQQANAADARSHISLDAHGGAGSSSSMRQAAPAPAAPISCWDFLAALPQLEHLVLFGCAQADAGLLQVLARLPHLLHLDLSGCRSLGLSHLGLAASLTRLTELDLQGCAGADAAMLRHVSKMAALQVLRLTGCHGCSPAAFTHLRPLTSLSTLHLSGSSGLSSLESLSSLAACAPRLQRLVLENADVGAASLPGLAPLTALSMLSLNSCPGVDAAALSHLPHAAAPLRHLSLNSCPSVDAAALAHVAGLAQLGELQLAGCNGRFMVDGVAAAGLGRLSALTALTSLHLQFCQGLDGSALLALAQLPRLQRLNVSYCPLEAGAWRHLAALPALEELAARGCRSLGGAVLAAVREALPHCTIRQ